MGLKIYTDGACSGNPGKGGWAAIILDKETIKFNISGNEKNTTNNRMELTGFLFEPFQLFSFHFLIQSVIPSFTYFESVKIIISDFFLIFFNGT